MSHSDKRPQHIRTRIQDPVTVARESNEYWGNLTSMVDRLDYRAIGLGLASVDIFQRTAIHYVLLGMNDWEREIQEQCGRGEQ